MHHGHLKRALLLAVAVVTGFGVWTSFAQEPLPNLKEVEQDDPQAELSGEKAKIWNSPQMLRARAWLQEYCETSAKTTPEQGKAYMQELEQLTPSQMKLWLLKFEEEHQQRQRQEQAWQQIHQASLEQAMAAQAQQQKANENINKGQTKTAEIAQRKLEQSQRETNIRQSEKRDWGYGGYGYGGYYGNHFHYHFYP